MTKIEKDTEVDYSGKVSKEFCSRKLLDPNELCVLTVLKKVCFDYPVVLGTL